jgi:hypothetical protein
MNQSNLPNPSYSALVGSRLYGIGTDESDWDIKGFIVPPINSLIGINKVRFHEIEYSEPNNKNYNIYSLQKFIEHIINGNTNLIESLWSTNIYTIDDIGHEIRNNRNMFLSKKFYRSIRGYAHAELKKAKALKLVLDRTNSYADAIERLTSTFQLKSYERDSIIDIIESSRPDLKIKMFVPNTRELGEKRKKLVDMYGYDVKSACHTVRLLYQGIELLRDHHLTFPSPQRDLLLKIRNGNMKLVEIETIIDDLEIQLNESFNMSKLPEVPDINQINNKYCKIVRGLI